jgi:hypothetical protein
MTDDLFTWAASRPQPPQPPEPPRGPARLYLYPVSRNARLAQSLAEGVMRIGGVRAAQWLDRETKRLGKQLRAAGLPDKAVTWEITKLLSKVGFALHAMNEGDDDASHGGHDGGAAA